MSHHHHLLLALALVGVSLHGLAGCAGPQDPPVDPPSGAPGSEPASSPDSSPTSAPAGANGVQRELLDGVEASLEGRARMSAVDMQVDVRFLADDARQGRGLGTKGLEEAGEYIARRFSDAGLEPAGDAGTFFQSFEVNVGAALEGDKAQALSIASRDLKLNQAWRPFAFSESGEVEAEVVFVGYGISAPELGYDDYEGVDVAGKIVLALRHEPGRRDAASKFEGAEPSRFSDLRYKAHMARQKGAAALIVINDPASHVTKAESDPDDLHQFHGGSAQAGLLVAHVTWQGGGALLKDVAGLDLVALQAEIDAKASPASKPTGRSARIAVSIVREIARVRNVVGVLTPSSQAEEKLSRHGALVVGAHYDHLGHGGAGSLRPGTEAIHNGADDNASGASVVMELAEAMATRRETLKRRIYFVAFTAEEVGLKGSEYFVAHPPVEVGQIGAMINFDMVGRLREGSLTVGGVGTAREFEALLGAAGVEGLKLNLQRDGFGPSDHSSFYAAKIPVLFMFTGAHSEYHTPDDDLETVNFEGMEQISILAFRLLNHLSHADERPFYTRAGVQVAGDKGGSGGRGYGKAWLGTVPSFDDTGGKGVKLQGVGAGSPAEAAGLQGKDLLVGLGGVVIKDLYDFTYALRDHKPGDKVLIVVMRGEERVEVEVTLGERKAEGP